MAITKTDFINYMRCPRYVALENIDSKKLYDLISLEAYIDREKQELLKELLSDINDLEEVSDAKLEVMLPYYKKIELLAGHLASKYFEGTFKFSEQTLNQECFTFVRRKLRYLCYVDIYNELDNYFNIIEVKATTSKKYLELTFIDEGVKKSIFTKNDKGIYYLLEDDDITYLSNKSYVKARAKLLDKYSLVGRYVYDLAIQRYIIENDLRQNGMDDKIRKSGYYLAVLNHDYMFQGLYDKDTPIYDIDMNKEEIIRYFDMKKITKEAMKIVHADALKIENYLIDKNVEPCPLGIYCEVKKTTKCKYIPVCWKHIPKHNSVFSYIDNHLGFMVDSFKKTTYDLINENYLKMTDVPNRYLTRKKNKIQKEVVLNHQPYINKKRIKEIIKHIKYPIYYLDFETFPCPLPRFKKEKCYSQSVFQYSLHVETEEGKCDKNLDHYEYLAPDNNDHREELIKSLIKHIDLTKGTIIVYNMAFEKGRLKELATIFPKYRKELMQMHDMIFDLLDVLKGNQKLYSKLNLNSDSIPFNYYHEDMNGSFSIKKILPLFSELSYDNLGVHNGVEALVTYANFGNMDSEEYKQKYQELLDYCAQDTWSMVEILWALKKI